MKEMLPKPAKEARNYVGLSEFWGAIVRTFAVCVVTSAFVAGAFYVYSLTRDPYDYGWSSSGYHIRVDRRTGTMDQSSATGWK